MPYRFAYSSNAFTRTDLASAIEAVARLGFEGIEILADRPHLDPNLVTPRDAQAIARRIRDAGLAVSNVNINTSRALEPESAGEGPGPTLVEEDARRRHLRLEYVLEAMERASAIGAEAVSITTGPLAAGAEPVTARRRFLDALTAILNRAHAVNLRVGIEFEPGFVVGDTASLLAVLDEARSPLLGANLDLGHAEVVGDAPEEAVRAFAGRTWNLHVEDIRRRVHHHLVPGDGDMDFARIRRALDETGYDRFLTLELYTCADAPIEAGRRGLASLRTLFGDGVRTCSR
ncbi:MAG: sugar phosphate isomerase/epimerase [Planctomycetes bacterium]|nr:sugar phosphate isomerase/epimerase [Planctomycetota bacterium]